MTQQQCNFFLSSKGDNINVVTILFLLEQLLGFNTTLNFWPVSLRNCKNDDRWHTELTYVLYSLLKKGVHRNFDQDRSYSMRVAIKIIWWLFGQLGSEHSGFLFETFFKTNQHCCWSTLVITALTFSTLPVPIRT